MKIKICERFNSPAIYMTIDVKQAGLRFCSSIFPHSDVDMLGHNYLLRAQAYCTKLGQRNDTVSSDVSFSGKFS